MLPCLTEAARPSLAQPERLRTAVASATVCAAIVFLQAQRLLAR